MAMSGVHASWGEVGKVPLVTVVIQGEGGIVKLPVHKEIAPLIKWLCEETQRRGYMLRKGHCWGYCFRRIRGGTGWSRHSWGTAVDLNAPANGMIKRKPGEDKFAKRLTDMPPWVPELWKSYGFGWGGDYRSTSDAMHFEALMSVDQARATIAKLAGGHAGPAVAASVAVAVQQVAWVTVREGSKGDAVKKVQTVVGAEPVDGIFGAGTLVKVRAWQSKNGLTVDGVVGPATAKKMNIL